LPSGPFTFRWLVSRPVILTPSTLDIKLE
jgi:hypothetical protein